MIQGHECIVCLELIDYEKRQEAIVLAKLCGVKMPYGQCPACKMEVSSKMQKRPSFRTRFWRWIAERLAEQIKKESL